MIASAMLPPLKSISLFTGAMGLDLGLEAAGYETRMVADLDKAAIETIKTNRPNLACFAGDVRDITGRDLLEIAQTDTIDLLAGGPPCQAFSTAGRRRGGSCNRNGDLVFEFIRLVDEVRPAAFLIENVKGILSAPLKWRPLPYNNNGKRVDDQYGALLRTTVHELKQLGYSCEVLVLNAADFGVPQARVRVFIVGFRDKIDFEPPQPSHSEDGGLFLSKWRTIKDAWVGMPTEETACAKFSERKLRYLKMVPPGSNWRSLPEELQRESMGKAFFAKGGRTGYWRRLSLDQTSPTILTEPQNASTSLCHPFEDRPLNVRECARIQTFPDTWQFRGTTAQQYRLIGNAVPPLLGECIGRSIKSSLANRKRLAA